MGPLLELSSSPLESRSKKCHVFQLQFSQQFCVYLVLNGYGVAFFPVETMTISLAVSLKSLRCKM